MAEVKAFIFGISLALTIGPIALLIITVATRDGLIAALWSALGAGSADFTLALAAFFAGAESPRIVQSIRLQMDLASAVVLIAVGLWMVLRSFGTHNSRTGKDPTLNAPFAQTYALTLVNPLGFITFAAFSAQLPKANSASRALYLAICLFAGSLTVQLLLAVSGSMFRFVFASSRNGPVLRATSGVVIASYGIVALCRAAVHWYR